MKARTKEQKRVVRLSKKNKFGKRRLKWASEHNLDHTAIRNKGGKITCLDCGESWKSEMIQGWHDEVLKVKCPSCKKELTVKQSQKRIFNDWSYITVINVIQEYQVISLYKISANYKTGQKRNIRVTNCTDTFINPKGRTYVIGKWQSSGMYPDRWCGDWELRNPKTASFNDVKPYQYHPNMEIIPILKRNGFEGDFHNFYPYQLFKLLLTNSKVETLFKAKEFELLRESINYKDVFKYWSSIKIALKNKYKLKNVSYWIDYLGFLEHFNIDLLNVKNVCPKDLVKEHDRLLDKKRKIENAKAEAIKLKAMKAEQKIYNKKRRLFKDLAFINDNLIVAPFKTVAQLKAESELLRHCAYESAYHKEDWSLMLSAKVDGIPVETVEVCLKSFTILQSRGINAKGKRNSATKHNKRIRALVKENMSEIKQAMKRKKRKTKIAA